MELAPRPLAFAPDQISGMSERLLTSHHANNYSGAVKRLNAIRTQLAALDFAAAPGFQVHGLKREALVATNSMLLRELYFASLEAARPWCRRWRSRSTPTSAASSAGVRSLSRWARRWPVGPAGCC
jgi:hypothetical protein